MKKNIGSLNKEYYVELESIAETAPPNTTRSAANKLKGTESNLVIRE